MSTISISARHSFGLLVAACMLAGTASGDELSYLVGGHTKGRFIGQQFPDNSIFNTLAGSGSAELDGDLRLNFEADKGPWRFNAAYQLVGMYGESVEYLRALPGEGVFSNRLPNDDRRYFDLTNVLQDAGKFAVLHRLDRLWLGYTGEKLVIRAGRQAISWGNGAFYSPMDIVNPFDPAAIDTEYKSGDDMLYGQYLRDNGHDIQVAAVFRRDPLSEDVQSDLATYSAKYHGIAGDNEYDLLVAQSYGDATFGIGGNRSLGGAVLGGDIVVTNTENDTTVQLVTNLSYSWTWGLKNVSGIVEYYFNGFGQKDGKYDPSSLAQNIELLKRFERGELFTLGRNYVAGAVTVEMSPLWTLTPNLLVNLDDPSAFLQVVSQHSLGDNATLLAALNIPIGPDGSEYAGIESGLPDLYFSTSAGIFLQLAWYF